MNAFWAEAQREGKPLDAIETTMLAFSEPTANHAELEAARTFESKYDDDAYESRIAALAGRVYERDVTEGRKSEWDQALDDVAEHDMYLHVMLEKAAIVKTTMSLAIPDWRLLWGLVPVVLCVGLAVVVGFTPWTERLIPNSFLRLGICIFLLFLPVLFNTFGRKRAD